MYCSNCGKSLNGSEKYCPNCGKEVTNNQAYYGDEIGDTSSGKTPSIILGILGNLGAVLVIFSPISFILSLIGLIIAIRVSKKVNNTAGIILNAIGLFLSLISLAVVIFFFWLVINVSDIDNYNDFWNTIYENREYTSNF